MLMALRRTPGLEKALRLPDMQLSMTAGMLLCKARIVVIDLESFEEGHMDRVRNAGQEWLTLEVADCVSVHTVPNVPSVFVLPVLPDIVPQDICLVPAEVQHKACHIMAFLQSMFHARVLARYDVPSYQGALLNWIGYRSFSRVALRTKGIAILSDVNFRKLTIIDSLYMGKELVTVTLHAGHDSLTPSPTLQSDVREGHFNAVKVPLSAAALLRCTEVLDTVYIRTASRRKAWSALSKKADHEHLLAESGTAFEPPPNPFLDEQKTTQKESKSKIMCDECRSLRADNHYHPICDRKLPKCSTCETNASRCSYPIIRYKGEKCKQCHDANRYCDLEEPTCSRCKKYDLLCSFGGDPTGTGNMDVGSESFRSQIRPLKRQHALKMTNAGYNAAFQAFKRAFLQDTLDREYQSGAERAQALRARGELVFDAWLDFIERWEIGESHFVDAYSGMNQPYFESRSDWEARFPFLLSPDAIQPLCVSEGKPAIHVVSNMLPTTWCLNKLKHIYSPVLLHLVWQLSQATASEQRLVIHRKIDHLYLIRLQLPFRRSARMQLDPQDPLIASVQTQNNAGIADPDNCLAIKRPWALQSDNRTFSKFGRPADSRAPYKEFPLHSKIEAVVSQIEERYNYTFKRIEGAVYLFNWENRPVEWTWDDNRRF